jgi:Fe2+ or Zn2+ uptake regulation protein
MLVFDARAPGPYPWNMASGDDMIRLLRDHGIQPSAQRLAIAEHVLRTDRHPTADRVLRQVQRRLPMVSRATVYNTLNLLVEKGLLRPYHLEEGPTVYDANVERHHHLVDEETGRVIDVPWDAVEVRRRDDPDGYDISSYMVVMRGRRRRGGGA